MKPLQLSDEVTLAFDIERMPLEQAIEQWPLLVDQLTLEGHLVLAIGAKRYLQEKFNEEG